MIITERDKKLLAFLAAFLIAAAFLFLVFGPLIQKNSRLQGEIEKAKEQELTMSTRASLAADMAKKEQVTAKETERVLKRFYPMLESQQAESMVTTLMLNHGLHAGSLRVIMPEKADDLPWYQYAKNAKPAVPGGEEEKEGALSFAVRTARITCVADGSRENLQAFIDDISGNFPAISIAGCEWSETERQRAQKEETQTENAQRAQKEETQIENAQRAEEDETQIENVQTETEKESRLTITLEIFMCEQ